MSHSRYTLLIISLIKKNKRYFQSVSRTWCVHPEFLTSICYHINIIKDDDNDDNIIANIFQLGMLQTIWSANNFCSSKIKIYRFFRKKEEKSNTLVWHKNKVKLLFLAHQLRGNLPENKLVSQQPHEYFLFIL